MTTTQDKIREVLEDVWHRASITDSEILRITYIKEALSALTKIIKEEKRKDTDRCSCGQEWVNHDNRKCEEWHRGAGLIPNAYDENGNPIKYGIS